jgi:hypothetical protein
VTVTRTGQGAITFDADRVAAIARIIAAVGKQPDDETKLAEDIEQAFVEFDIQSKVKRARGGDHGAKLRSLRKNLEKEIKLIKSEPFLKKYADDLLLVVKALGWYETWRDRHAAQYRVIKGRKPSPLEWLAGVLLPIIYVNRFDAPVTFDRDDERKPHGALIGFIAAVLAELGLPYTAESIARAVTRLKNNYLVE